MLFESVIRHSFTHLGVSIYVYCMRISIRVNRKISWVLESLTMIAIRLVVRMMLVMLLMPLIVVMMTVIMLSTRSPFCVSLLYLWLFHFLFIFFLPFIFILVDILLVLVLGLRCLWPLSSLLCLRILSSGRIASFLNFNLLTVHKLVVHPLILDAYEHYFTKLVVMTLDLGFLHH